MASNLKRRHQTWYVRVRVNPKYAKLIGKYETIRSLQTSDRRVAEGVKNGAIQQIKDYHERLIREAQAGLSGQVDDSLQLRRQVEQGGLTDYNDELGRDENFAVEIAHDQLEARLRGLGRTPAEIEAMTADDIPDVVRDSFRNLNPTSALSLTAAIKLYLDDIEADVAARTWSQKKRQLELFADWAGNIPLTAVDRKLSSRYINEHLRPMNLAVNYGKNIVAMLTAFFNWLIDNSLYETMNPFTRKAKSFKESRTETRTIIKNRAWTPDELRTLFDATDKQRKGSVKYWSLIGARIALYTGLRREELAGMRLDDVNLDEGFMAVPKGRSKNTNSERQVVIHPGVADLIRDLHEGAEDDYLLPGLPIVGGDNKRGHTLGNRFGDVKRGLFPDSAKGELTFHGMRSTFITAMERAGIPESTAKLIDGHARQSLSYGLYSKGPGFDALKDAVTSVNIEIRK